MKNGYRGGEGDPKDVCSGGGGGIRNKAYFPIQVQVIWRFVVLESAWAKKIPPFGWVPYTQSRLCYSFSNATLESNETPLLSFV